MKRNPLFLLILALPAIGQQPAAVTLSLKSEVTIEEKDGFRVITANGVPNHPVGRFPSRGNPNAISAQDYHFRVPLTPKPAVQQARGIVFGVALNGVVFDPGTAETWNGDMRWHYEALTGMMGTRGKMGADESLAHVQPNGAYHYHGMPVGLLEKLDYKKKMTLVGWAADGYPIYGPYAYTNPTDPKSPLKNLKAAYKLKSGNRPGGTEGPGGVCDGSFQQDYEFVKGGDLDETCGRTGVTPEFPKGTYYYVVTENWPFIPRRLKGAPDPSFRKGGPTGLDRNNPGTANRNAGAGTPGGGAAMKANSKFLFIQRGNTLYQYSADGLKLLGKTELPPP
ncbi:MAG: YHYH protein [Armatimonadetes bacterium]|nr:YHYH protein [Armatimonadota bacterium]